MLEIQKTGKGFLMNGYEYLFTNFDGLQYEIITETQVHIGTNEGIMLLDLSVSIDKNVFTDITAFVNYLFS
jgi:hypothetical protein